MACVDVFDEIENVKEILRKELLPKKPACDVFDMALLTAIAALDEAANTAESIEEIGLVVGHSNMRKLKRALCLTFEVLEDLRMREAF